MGAATPARSPDGEADAPIRVLRPPTRDDGAAVHALVAACPPLDLNSTYAYLLLCEHFANTCVVAESGGEQVGFVSAYILPQRPDTLFVWQVAVGERARGLGLATAMLKSLLDRPGLQDVRWLETTVAADNAASRGCFARLAQWVNAPLQELAFFERDAFGGADHDAEPLLRIGPFGPGRPRGHVPDPGET